MVALVLTLVLVVAVGGLVAGWIGHGNYAHRYWAERRMVAELEPAGRRAPVVVVTQRAPWSLEEHVAAALGVPVTQVRVDVRVIEPTRIHPALPLYGDVIDGEVVRPLTRWDS